MKKIKNLLPEIYDYENIYLAWKQASKGKRYRNEVLEFERNLEENLINIQNHFIYGSYVQGKFREFYVNEPKRRLVMALPFPDRVVQWAIYRQLFPLLEKQFIEDSFACRVGKGTHKAADRLQYWLRQVDRKPENYYYLKLDVAKYFYRIDHQILLHILSHKIGDKPLMDLLQSIICDTNTAFGLALPTDGIGVTDEMPRLWHRGMPIGNLTSQMFSNVYLNELDQFCKHHLKLHYYVRYMDDIIILGDSKSELHRVKMEISSFLDNHLKLHLNNKTTIRPCTMGVEFVGYRLWATHRKLKKKTARKMIHSARYLGKARRERNISKERFRGIVASYRGALEHFNSVGLRNKMNRAYIKGRRGRGRDK